jgi:hypothetical protein
MRTPCAYPMSLAESGESRLFFERDYDKPSGAVIARHTILNMIQPNGVSGS